MFQEDWQRSPAPESISASSMIQRYHITFSMFLAKESFLWFLISSVYFFGRTIMGPTGV